VLSEGKVCVLDIDIHGVEKLKQTELNPHYVFIMPPSIEELDRRLRNRGTETDNSIQIRLEAAKEEIEYGECQHQVVCIGYLFPPHYNFVLLYYTDQIGTLTQFSNAKRNSLSVVKNRCYIS
jgi:hypothetical protein